MDGAFNVKKIDYGKVNHHITKSGGDVDQPTINDGAFFHTLAKKAYYPFPTF